MMMSQTGSDSAPAGNPPPPERRTTSRHSVDDTALIILVKVASKIAGRIVDLSLGGCRIRCDDRFPVGIYTRVETEFRIEGLSFRLGGVIQAIHDRHTIGIRFLDMSARKHEQLEQLIEEINEAHARKAAADNGAAIPPSDLSGL
jgi:c-di-GMP-binding flagellar brake protein YcgR